MAKAVGCGWDTTSCIDAATGEFIEQNGQPAPSDPSPSGGAGARATVRVYAMPTPPCEKVLNELEFLASGIPIPDVLSRERSKIAVKDALLDLGSVGTTQVKQAATAALTAVESQDSESIKNEVSKLREAAELDHEPSPAVLNLVRAVEGAAKALAYQAICYNGETADGKSGAQGCLYLKEWSDKLPTDPTIAKYQVTARSTVSSDSPVSKPSASYFPSRTTSFAVTHGRYYFDFGLSISYVSRGKKEFSKDAAGAIQNARFGGAPRSFISVTLYPAGRIRGAILNLSANTRKDKALSYLGWFGFQLGINSDVLKITEAFSFSGVFEPVSGLALIGGLTVLEQDRLRRGYSAGELAPANDAHLTRSYYARWHVGVSLNYEINQLLRTRNDD